MADAKSGSMRPSLAIGGDWARSEGGRRALRRLGSSGEVGLEATRDTMFIVSHSRASEAINFDAEPPPAMMGLDTSAINFREFCKIHFLKYPSGKQKIK